MHARRLFGALLVPSLLALPGCVEEVTYPVEVFGATLAGAAETPPVVTAASGAATFRVQGPIISFDVTLLNTAAVTAAHIHLGGAGVPGAVLLPLGGALSATVTVSATAYSGVITEAQLTGTGVSLDSLVSLFRTQNAYVNVHTVAFPDGAVRGQIGPK